MTNLLDLEECKPDFSMLCPITIETARAKTAAENIDTIMRNFDVTMSDISDASEDENPKLEVYKDEIKRVRKQLQDSIGGYKTLSLQKIP